MDKATMTRVFKKVKDVYNLDFVRTDMGYCCHTCADFKSDKIEKEYRNAETYLIISHFLGGMNYGGPFADAHSHTARWHFPEGVVHEDVVRKLQELLNEEGLNVLVYGSPEITISFTDFDLSDVHRRNHRDALIESMFNKVFSYLHDKYRYAAIYKLADGGDIPEAVRDRLPSDEAIQLAVDSAAYIERNYLDSFYTAFESIGVSRDELNERIDYKHKEITRDISDWYRRCVLNE